MKMKVYRQKEELAFDRLEMEGDFYVEAILGDNIEYWLRKSDSTLKVLINNTTKCTNDVLQGVDADSLKKAMMSYEEVQKIHSIASRSDITSDGIYTFNGYVK